MKSTTYQTITHAKQAQNRAAFWAYCQRAASAAIFRSKRRCMPCNIDAYSIDELLVDQEWRCAVSGIKLTPTVPASKSGRDPFGPSLDRIIPTLGYVRGNLRIVCNMANFAMNEWGVENLRKLVESMKKVPLRAKKTPGTITIDLRTGEYTLYRCDGSITVLSREEADRMTSKDRAMKPEEIKALGGP